MKFRSLVLFTCLSLMPIDLRSTHAVEARSISPVGMNGNLVVLKEEFRLLKNERIGSLKIGLTEAKVKQIIDCKLQREPEKFWAGDGAYHQTWKYTDCGIELDMVSSKKGAPKSIGSIKISQPSRLKTARGIQIGSTRAAVETAYRADKDREMSNAKTLVAGSIYGGLIFQFQNGKVNQIFLGAAAE